MKNDFAPQLTSFLTHYLPDVKGASRNTISSYSDTCRLFLEYCRDHRGLKPESMSVGDISAEIVERFLDWLEKDRCCSVSTRNQRMAALNSFFRYVQIYHPERLGEIQRILALPQKKMEQVPVNFISFDSIKILLSQPDRSTRKGRRDHTMLCLLYDTGARVSELTGIRVMDIRLDAPSRITLRGKGSKRRTVPLMKDTSDCIASYMEEAGLMDDVNGSEFLFRSHDHKQFTRAGIAYILRKYVESARQQGGTFPDRVTPHVLRHSKAMHLLQAGVNIVYIKDILGHADITTTQVYVRADLKMKAEALEKVRISVNKDVNVPAWANDADLIQWLEDLSRQTR